MSGVDVATVQWECTRKAAYWTQRAAKAAQKRDEKKYGVKMHRYRCAYCDHWHLAKRKQP